MAALDEFITYYVNDLISADELLRVFEVYLERPTTRSAPRRLSLMYGFSIESFSDQEVVLLFRFHREHIPELQRLLQIPIEIVTDGENGYRVPGTLALCILLRRLSYPNRLTDLERLFGISKSGISVIVKWMTDYVTERFRHLLHDLGRISYLNEERLSAYAEAVVRMGAPLQNCWGFVDGTTRKICRPTVDQHLYYSGHKRYHCVKYQSILTPDGIIVNLQGPYQGRRHDAGIWNTCGVTEQIRRLCVTPHRTFVLYGDPAYPVSDILITPYPSVNTNPNAIAFNRAMSKVRQSVEWGFGKVLQQFPFVDFSKNQKLLLQDIGGTYAVAVLLTNCHTCLYGSQTSQYFGAEPPTLEEYLQS